MTCGPGATTTRRRGAARRRIPPARRSNARVREGLSLLLWLSPPPDFADTKPRHQRGGDMGRYGEIRGDTRHQRGGGGVEGGALSGGAQRGAASAPPRRVGREAVEAVVPAQTEWLTSRKCLGSVVPLKQSYLCPQVPP